MSVEVYTRLREFLDSMPGCFPATESGVEMKILKKLFTPEQAEITMKLTPMPEPLSEIAPRLGMSESEASEKLEELAKEGSIMRVRTGEQALYFAISFVVGIYEFHLNTIDRELSEYMKEYFPYMAKAWESVGTKQLRVVPIEASLHDEKKVGNYAQIRELIKDKELIAVSPCICTKEKGHMDEPCSRPEERCIQFDMAAQAAVFFERLNYEDNAQYYLIWSALAKRAGAELEPNAEWPARCEQRLRCCRQHL